MTDPGGEARRPPEDSFVDLARASDEELAGAGKSRMFFPLRGGVEFFADPSMPGAVARAKEAALLYDEVVFEPGLYEVSIAQDGSWDAWTPPQELTPEALAEARQIQAPGTNFSVSMGLEGGGEMFSVMGSPLDIAYAAEYRTGILDELARFSPDWVKLATLGPNPLRMGTEPGDLWRRQQRADRHDESLMPEARRGPGRPKREWIIKTFNQDSVAASLDGSAFNPTSLFVPMVRRRAGGAPRDGREALSVLVPNVGGLPWEAVLGFREHPGNGEARAMLREFEEKAAREEPEDAEAFLSNVHNEITGALLWMVEGSREPLPERIAVEAIKQGVGFVPVVGPLAGIGLAAAEIGTDAYRRRRSWTAALMVLRGNRGG